jgi:hypothetical protein
MTFHVTGVTVSAALATTGDKRPANSAHARAAHENVMLFPL